MPIVEVFVKAIAFLNELKKEDIINDYALIG